MANRFTSYLMLVSLVLSVSFYASYALANPLQDNRYTNTIKRTKNGHIHRRADVIAAFKKIHPCPVTGKTKGSCPGWQIDHVIPLACYGKDTVSNMQWLPKNVKTCAKFCKDRFERKIYALENRETAHCKRPSVSD